LSSDHSYQTVSVDASFRDGPPFACVCTPAYYDDLFLLNRPIFCLFY